MRHSTEGDGADPDHQYGTSRGKPTDKHMMETMKKTLTALAAALILALAFATVAIGQSSTEEGYTQQGPDVVNQVEDDDQAEAPAATTQTPDDGDELPFTGLDLALLAGAGGMLLALGLGMRRLTRSPESA